MQDQIAKCDQRPCRLYIKQFPSYYPNFAPFLPFNIISNMTFDMFQQFKIVTNARSFLVNLMKECVPNEFRDIMRDDMIQKIALRFV